MMYTFIWKAIAQLKHIKLKGIFKNRFAKNVFMIAGGAAFAQVISLLLSPVITRIYSPEEFSTLTLFISILGIICLLGTLSYESAIPIAANDNKAINLLLLSLIILCLITFLLTVTIFLFSDFLLLMLNATDLVNYKYFIVIGFFMTGLYAILTEWALRKKNYKGIARTKYSQSIIGNGGKIALGFMGLGPIGLIFGQILGQSAGIINLYISFSKERRSLLKNIDLLSIWWCAKRYVRFPKYSAPTLFIISLTSQLPVFFLSAFYNPETVGYYGLALTITFLPMGIIGKSVEDVFYGEVASLGKSNATAIKKISRGLLKKLSIIGAIPMIILILLGPELFVIVFGVNWYNGGVFASVLAIYAYTHFIFQPISMVFFVFEEQHLQLYLNITKIVLVIIVFYMANILDLSAVLAILIFSITMGCAEFCKYLMAQYVINKHTSQN